MPTDPRADLAACECGHVLRDHSLRELKPCLICDDCPIFLWSGRFFRAGTDNDGR